jgi:hypothetical protein
MSDENPDGYSRPTLKQERDSFEVLIDFLLKERSRDLNRNTDLGHMINQNHNSIIIILLILCLGMASALGALVLFTSVFV